MAIAIELRGRKPTDWANKVAKGGRNFLADAANPRYLIGRVAWVVLLTGILVESLLGVRLWAQLTNQEITTGTLALVFDVTGVLVSPFAGMEPSQPIKTTGVLEFATLVALEAYLATTLAALLTLFIVPKLVRLVLFVSGLRSKGERS